MIEIVTFEQLLNIKEEIQENAHSNEQNNQLLNDSVCDNFNTIKYKKNLLSLFETFKNAKYLYSFPNSYKITFNYNNTKVNSSRKSSQVEKTIEKMIDKQLITTKIYYSIIALSYKLTGKETIYLINTFLDHKSEEEIAYLAGISKTYLQKIKKSCIVKMWTDLKEFCKEDN